MAGDGTRLLASLLGEFGRAVEGGETDPELFIKLGTSLEEQQAYDEAFEAYDRAVVLAPERADCWWKRGAVLANKLGLAILGKEGVDEVATLAYSSFEQALALEPLQIDALRDSIICLMLLGRYGEALASCRTLLSLAGDEVLRSDVLFKMGLAKMLGGYEGAAADFNEIIEEGTDVAEAYFGLGLLALKEGGGEALAGVIDSLRVRDNDLAQGLIRLSGLGGGFGYREVASEMMVVAGAAGADQ